MIECNSLFYKRINQDDTLYFNQFGKLALQVK